MLACDLLVEGVDGDAVTALAVQSPRALPVHEAERLLDDLVRELAVPQPTALQAGDLVAADVCARMLDGSLRLEDGAHQLLGAVAHEGAFGAAVVDPLLALLDRLEYDLHGSADPEMRRALLNFAQALAERQA